MGALTTRGKCNACGARVAWRERPMAERRAGGSKWQLCDPEIGPDGTIVTVTYKNGDGKVATRAKASERRHLCGASKAPSASDPLPVATVEATAKPPMCGMRDDDYTCTEPRGHVGHHIAGGSVPLHTWGAPVTKPTADPDVEEAPACMAKGPRELGCTLDKGHTGNHKAHGRKGDILATWNDDPVLPRAASEAWLRAETIIERTKIHRILLYGPPGTGKTTLPHRIADKMGAACYSLTLTEETPASALVGQFIIKGGDVVWMDGVATRAMRESQSKPVILVLNEIDHASGDAMTKLIEVMDDPSLVAIYLPTGEVVKPKADNWRIVATSNAEPNALIPAVTDRLHANVCITHPHPGLVASLYSIEAKRLLTSASREFSIRAILSWDGLMRDGMSLEDAAKLVFEPSAAQSLIDAARLAARS